MSNRLILMFACLQSIYAENKSQRQCRCGVRTNNIRNKRIVLGQRVGYREFPWYASIFYQYEYTCGGSIINDLYILTAGHCIRGESQNMFVVVGNPELIPGNRTNQLKVKYITIHQRFKNVKFHHDIYDIGLIRLKNRLIFAPGRISPICLPLLVSSLYRLRGTIVASEWRNIRNYKIGLMQKATVTLMSSIDCRKTLIANYVTSSYDQIICARSIRYDACQGDSGGPLQISVADSVVLAGIISWGVNCGNFDYPGIYTNVQFFLPWITRHTSDATYCTQ